MNLVTRTAVLTAATAAAAVAFANPASATTGSDFLVWQRTSSVATADTTTLKGDMDRDGDVDGRDFLIWQRGGSPTAGDVDHDSDVDAADFLIWQRT